MCALKNVEKIKGDLVDFTQALVRIPSITGDEGQIAQLVLKKLQEFELEEAWIDGIGNVVGVLRGSGRGPNVLLNGHLDVVPAGRLENWSFDPFEAIIERYYKP